MLALRTMWIVVFILASGCTWVKETPLSVSAQSAPLNVDPSLVGTKQRPSVAAEPPLDVAGLKARLRNSDAIGAFTKRALENQVDDLLSQFRTRYQSEQTTSVAHLRQPYDMLVLKVLALVQDIDRPLARTVLESREAIWGILADPQKFVSVT